MWGANGASTQVSAALSNAKFQEFYVRWFLAPSLKVSAIDGGL
jgi:hypothetical protein